MLSPQVNWPGSLWNLRVRPLGKLGLFSHWGWEWLGLKGSPETRCCPVWGNHSSPGAAGGAWGLTPLPADPTCTRWALLSSQEPPTVIQRRSWTNCCSAAHLGVSGVTVIQTSQLPGARIPPTHPHHPIQDGRAEFSGALAGVTWAGNYQEIHSHGITNNKLWSWKKLLNSRQ